ncbi:MAG: DEAD/DEAH box helicase family protein, partial [Negativicutes bacterium]|nr:DEAD/DEAH box helicase family protein [Negativicutes bacterium]
MKDVLIENPVITSPFAEPERHFIFDDNGITSEIADGRRPSCYYIPIPKPKKKLTKQEELAFEQEYSMKNSRRRENQFINELRAKVRLWRLKGYQGLTNGVTRRLLEYWRNPARDKKLFFCQIEVLETAIYITEVAAKIGDTYTVNTLAAMNAEANSTLERMAFKMATGSGKTVVMAMLIAWHVLNKAESPQNARFSDAFLIVTPGITIRDRLRVLLPSDPENYYQKRDIVPPEYRDYLSRAKIVITNYHAFKLRELTDAGKLTKSILATAGETSLTETPDQMVRRVCRELGNKKNIIVINDEAHHCYREKAVEEEEKLSREEKKEAEKNKEAARLWISGIEAVKAKLGVRAVYDLSATPFYLKGSGYPEGTLFQWVVSDFSLTEAIESGIVKVPRVPVADNSMVGDMPTYRDLWYRIRDELPKKGRGTEAVGGEPQLPKELQGAILSLYSNYEKYYREWANNQAAKEKGLTPPVFIIVCNNTNVSKLVYDYIAGWEKTLPDGQTVLVPGELALFNNVENGTWRARPNTILIDSEQLDSGEAMTAEFKKIAAKEIEHFKQEIRARSSGVDVASITDEDLLREVMNTVGKPGKLGEQIRCVVSVSMLTEGWDANTVTHILGVRAFGTQLLCEQVVGRGLRRISYAVEPQTISYNGNMVTFEAFPAEYAEVYGVPFEFIPTNGAVRPPVAPKPHTRVRALAERANLEITFPRVTGYRYDIASEKLACSFGPDSKLILSTRDVPTETENRAVVGTASLHTLDDIKAKRPNEVAFRLAKYVLETYFREEAPPDVKDDRYVDRPVKTWLFPQILAITKTWLSQCVTLQDNTFIQLLLLHENGHNAATKIYNAIVTGASGDKTLMPILRPYDTVGSTRHVDFDTTRPVYPTDPYKCHVSHVVCDTESWEQKTAQALENMKEVSAYVKNHNLGFTIPYNYNGEHRQYIPDYLVHWQTKSGDRINLILETSGEKRDDKAAKVAAARNLWVPAINNHGGFGRWAFIEVSDPWDAENTIRTIMT